MSKINTANTDITSGGVGLTLRKFHNLPKLYMTRFYFSQLGTTIRETRSMLQMSQTELAERAGLSLASISRIEGGHRGISIGNIISVANALELPPAFILMHPIDQETFKLGILQRARHMKRSGRC